MRGSIMGAWDGMGSHTRCSHAVKQSAGNSPIFLGYALSNNIHPAPMDTGKKITPRSPPRSCCGSNQRNPMPRPIRDDSRRNMTFANMRPSRTALNSQHVSTTANSAQFSCTSQADTRLVSVRSCTSKMES